MTKKQVVKVAEQSAPKQAPSNSLAKYIVNKPRTPAIKFVTPKRTQSPKAASVVRKPGSHLKQTHPVPKRPRTAFTFFISDYMKQSQASGEPVTERMK